MVGPIFELHPSNLVRIHIFLSCKNDEKFVTKSQLVLELAKISVSVPRPCSSLSNKHVAHFIIFLKVFKIKLNAYTYHESVYQFLSIGEKIYTSKFKIKLLICYRNVFETDNCQCLQKMLFALGHPVKPKLAQFFFFENSPGKFLHKFTDDGG